MPDEIENDIDWEADFREGWKQLRELCRAAHPKDGMQVASSCTCGWGAGKHNNSACRMLDTLKNFVRHAESWADDPHFKKHAEQLRRAIR